jgi:hypothetical protein
MHHRTLVTYQTSRPRGVRLLYTSVLLLAGTLVSCGFDDIGSTNAAVSNSGYMTGLAGYYPFPFGYTGPSIAGHCSSSGTDGQCSAPAELGILVFGCAQRTYGEPCGGGGTTNGVELYRTPGPASYTFSNLASMFPQYCTFQLDVGVLEPWDIRDYAIWERDDCGAPPNSPPVARCTDVVVCADPDTCAANASVDAGSSDPDNPFTITQAPSGPYTIGTHVVTLTITSSDGSSDWCRATVTVNDCDPPQFDCPEMVAECDDYWGTPYTPLPPENIVDCSDTTASYPGPGEFPYGITMLPYEVTDEYGHETEKMCPLLIDDTLPPEVDPVEFVDITRNSHNCFVEVKLDQCVESMFDQCMGEMDIMEWGRIIRVSSDEPVDVPNPNRVPDIQFVTGDLTSVWLRPERIGNPNQGGNGRVYVIEYVIVDPNGNVSPTLECEAHVKHDQNDDSAVRDDPVYYVDPSEATDTPPCDADAGPGGP